MADAKSRMCIYGSESALRTLAAFYRTGGTLSTPTGMPAYLDLYESMRKETDRSSVPRDDLAMIIFGEDGDHRLAATSKDRHGPASTASQYCGGSGAEGAAAGP
jgi:hypothetical protein